jgi:hypothetical protein
MLVFDRIFDRENLEVVCAVQKVDHAGQRGAFAAPG